MTKSKPTSKWLWLTKVLGTLGYTSLLLQWGWWALLFLPSLLDSQLVKEFLLPTPSKQPEVVVQASGTYSLLYSLIAIVAVVVVLALTVYVLAKIPGQIAKGGNKIITTTTAAALPVLTHKKKVSAKKRRMISLRISKLVKLIFAVVPLALLGMIALVPISLPTDVAWTIGAFLATGSVLWFSLQYLAAKLLAIDEQLLI